MAFSSKMNPGQLASWLLEEYGEDYKDETEKLKKGMINGELFLLLPEDEELLQSLNLGLAFKRLVVMKAKELKGSANSVTTGSGEPGKSVGEGQQANPAIPVCTTVDSVDEKEGAGDTADCGGGQLDPDSLAAWVHKNAIWKGRKELRVKFLDDKIPDGWRYKGHQLEIDDVITWANEWSLGAGDNIIPKFVRVENRLQTESDIRVVFTTGKTESKIGMKAELVKEDKPTMWLNLHSVGISDGFKKHLVVHEFGHALGLGHEHQRSDFWKLLKPYLNEAAMKERLGVDGGDFERDWGGSKKFAKGKSTPYDPESVMHYWFMKDWLKPPYNDRNKVLEHVQPNGPLSQEAANVLLGVHERDVNDNPPRESPSNQDIQLLKDRYGSRRSDSCTVSGPPVIGGGEATHTQDVLSKESHELLYSQLKVHASKWWDVGTHLGFTQAELHNIQDRPALYNGAPTSYLRAMLSDWLEWTCDPASPTHKPATLERLKYAVSQAGLGRTATELHI